MVLPQKLTNKLISEKKIYEKIFGHFLTENGKRGRDSGNKFVSSLQTNKKMLFC